MRRRTALALGGAVLALAGAGWWLFGRGADAASSPGASPFAFWTLRAGEPFAPLEKRLGTTQEPGWSCAPFVAGGRLCQIVSGGIPTTELPGLVRAVTDSTNTVVALRFAIASRPSPAGAARAIADHWERELGEIERAWGRIDLAPDHVRGSYPRGEATIWRSANGRWSALLDRDSLGIPRAIVLADDSSLARVAVREPVAPYALAELGFGALVDSTAVRAGELLLLRAEMARAMFGR